MSAKECGYLDASVFQQALHLPMQNLVDWFHHDSREMLLSEWAHTMVFKRHHWSLR